ncbi:MAG: Dabb family protein [Phycisphaerales bacterium]
MKTASTLLIAAIFLFLPACSSGGQRTALPPVPPPAGPPAMIGHIVFIQLQSPSDFHALLHDADWMLGTIPSVESYAAGKHLDTGRSTVSSDYDLAVYLGFKSEADLRAYVIDDQHVDFVNKWKPRLKSLTVYDMLDWPTTRYGVR